MNKNSNQAILLVGVVLIIGTHFYQSRNNNFIMALVVTGYLVGLVLFIVGVVGLFKSRQRK